MTCLEMSREHIRLIKQNKFKSLGDQKAYVHYSEALDLLVKDDWGDLVELMITLGSIGEELQRPLENSLVEFLPRFT